MTSRTQSCRAENRERIRLRSARTEDDLPALGSKAGGNALACLVEHGPSATPLEMKRTSVLRRSRQERHHRCKRLGQQRGGRRVVEVNSRLGHRAFQGAGATILPCEAPLHTPRSSNGNRRSEVTRTAFFLRLAPPARSRCGRSGFPEGTFVRRHSPRASSDSRGHIPIRA